MIDNHLPVTYAPHVALQPVRARVDASSASTSERDSQAREETVVLDGELLDRMHEEAQRSRGGRQRSGATYASELERDWTAVDHYQEVAAMHGNRAYHPGCLLSRSA